MNFLIVSYYAQPCNSVATLRINAIIDKILSDKNKVTVISRNWKGNENTWQSYLSDEEAYKINYSDNIKYIYLPYKKYKYNTIGFIRKIKWIINALKGVFSIETNTLQFYEYIKTNFSKNEFDYIITSSPPLNIVKLGFKLKKYFINSKWIVDFRDLQNHVLLQSNIRLTFKTQFEQILIKWHLKKWLRKSEFCLVANKEFSIFLNAINCKTEIVLNGFNCNNFNDLPKIDSTIFQITLLGTIYNEQNINLLLQIINKFYEQNKDEIIKINFIGTGAIHQVKEKIEKIILPKFIITDRISYTDALNIGSKSAVLIYAGWKGYKGVYSKKIFDYIGLKRHILIAPNDNDVIEEIIYTIGYGKITDSVDVGVAYLSDLYKLWKIKDERIYPNVETAVYNKYSINVQLDKLLDRLK